MLVQNNEAAFDLGNQIELNNDQNAEGEILADEVNNSDHE